jgi:mannose-6-phosphate isomerase-like protein (cupin superfamily)
MQPTMLDLLSVDHQGPDGAIWSLPHGGDLDANLVHLGPGGAIGEHRNDDVDVLLVGIDGAGWVTIDEVQTSLRPGTLVAVPKGTTRSIRPHAEVELVYLSVHRSRAGLQIRR